MLRSKNCWAIVIAHSCSNYAVYVLLGWLPTWWKQRHSVVLASNPFYGATPCMFGLIGSLVAGNACDYALRKYGDRLRVRTVRTGAAIIGGIGAATFLMLADQADDPLTASALLCVHFFFGRFFKTGFWVNMLDVAGPDAGKLMGISNTVATVPGIVGQKLTHRLLDATGSWTYVWGLAAGSQLLGALLFTLLAGDELISKARNARPQEPNGQTELASSFSEPAPR